MTVLVSAVETAAISSKEERERESLYGLGTSTALVYAIERVRSFLLLRRLRLTFTASLG